MTAWSEIERQVRERAVERCEYCRMHQSHDWETHFQWDGYRVLGRTSIGQATIDALSLNHARRIKIRRAEELCGLFPPTDDDTWTERVSFGNPIPKVRPEYSPFQR